MASEEKKFKEGFVLGFAFLKQQLGPIMGNALEPEHPSADSCDTQQRTTTGLAYWRCSTNTMSFVSQDSGGLVHWAWLSQLLTWHGDGVDPPSDATVFSPTAEVPQQQLDVACVLPGASLDTT